jgi:beta-lactamase superfamily II metal-dependent hydrolase
MIFSLDVCRARKGDCLLLHFGSKSDPGLIMIDGGPKDVYRPHLKPRLEQIRKSRGLAKEDSLMVDLLMVSHVDDDHIRGILDLTKDEIVAFDAGKPLMLNVQSFWHNSFDEIIDHKPDELLASVKKQFGTASTSGNGELPDDEKLKVEEKFGERNPGESAEVLTSGLKVLASIEQGFRLRLDAKKLSYPINPEFDSKLIIARKGTPPIPIGTDLKFTVVGPLLPEITALHKKHQDWLKELKAKGLSPADALAAFVDKSVPNLSSIVVLAELGGKRMLLTGDARGDKVLSGLETVGLVKKGGELAVDVLKVPHHGSANNLDDEFFERIIAKHYVFSGNGEHGNPERESMEMLWRARGDKPFTVHLTYPVAEIDVERKKDWEKEQAKEKKKRAGKKTAAEKKKVEVRPDWSPKKHSLAAFFKEMGLGPGQKIEIVPDKGAHMIHLLDLAGP